MNSRYMTCYLTIRNAKKMNHKQLSLLSISEKARVIIQLCVIEADVMLQRSGRHLRNFTFIHGSGHTSRPLNTCCNVAFVSTFYRFTNIHSLERRDVLSFSRCTLADERMAIETIVAKESRRKSARVTRLTRRTSSNNSIWADWPRKKRKVRFPIWLARRVYFHQ